MDWRWSASRGRRASQLILGLLLVAAASGLAGIVNRHYPIQHWMFWRLLGYWVASAAFCVGAMALGHVLLRPLISSRLKFTERLAFDFAVGLIAMALAIFVLGLLGLLHWSVFFLLPASAMGLGVFGWFSRVRKFARHLKFRRRRRRPAALLQSAIVFGGLVGLGMIYFVILTPDNIQYDSRWRHLAMAEHYSSGGVIERFAEGWIPGASPQLASYLYTWAFLVPKGQLFDRIELAAHLEFAVFLLTTWFGIPAAVRRLSPRANATVVWTARMIFPGVYLYDSNLSGGADHIGAAFGPAILLALLRCLKSFEKRDAVLLALVMSGAVLTKETAAALLVPAPAILLIFGAIIATVKRWRCKLGSASRPFAAVMVTGVAGVTFTSAHWLKNWVFYADPVYPMGYPLFRGNPRLEATTEAFRWGFLDGAMWQPTRDWSGVMATLQTLFTFSFIPNDWDSLHRDVPVFGSLFTLFLVSIPFIRGAKRVWLLVAWIHLSLVIWYWINHQDRYLQTLVPLMAVVVAALIVTLWRQGTTFVRAATALLVVTQIVVAGDTYFIQTHRLIHTSPIKRVVDLLEGGFRKHYEPRLESVMSAWQPLGKGVPRGSKLLLHEFDARLGVGAPAVTDWTAFQLGIHYPTLNSPRGVWEHLKNYGVSHIVWGKDHSRGVHSLAGDVVFFDFVMNHCHDRKVFGLIHRVRLPDKPPPAQFDDRVLVVGCHLGLGVGIYRRSQLTAYPFGPDAKRYPGPERPLVGEYSIMQAAKRVPAAISEEQCTRFSGGDAGLTRVARRDVDPNTGAKPYVIWIRSENSKAFELPVPLEVAPQLMRKAPSP